MSKNELNVEEYNAKLNEALKTMNPKELKRFFAKYDKVLYKEYKLFAEIGQKEVLCKLIMEQKSMKNTPQYFKAKKFLTRRGISVDE